MHRCLLKSIESSFLSNSALVRLVFKTIGTANHYQERLLSCLSINTLLMNDVESRCYMKSCAMWKRSNYSNLYTLKCHYKKVGYFNNKEPSLGAGASAPKHKRDIWMAIFG